MAVFKQCNLLLWALCLVVLPVLAARVPKISDFDTGQIDRGDALREIAKIASDNSVGPAAGKARRGLASGCTTSTLRIRREWWV